MNTFGLFVSVFKSSVFLLLEFLMEYSSEHKNIILLNIHEDGSGAIHGSVHKYFPAVLLSE